MQAPNRDTRRFRPPGMRNYYCAWAFRREPFGVLSGQWPMVWEVAAPDRVVAARDRVGESHPPEGTTTVRTLLLECKNILRILQLKSAVRPGKCGGKRTSGMLST